MNHRGEHHSHVLRTVLAVLLVVCATAGGLGYSFRTADKADHEVGTKVWQAPEHKTPDNRWEKLGWGRADSELSKQLLPAERFTAELGPDIGEYGNDVELSDKSAVALLKESGSGLPPQERRAHSDFIEKLEVKGIAMRSYTVDGMVHEIRIAQMENRRGIQTLRSAQQELFQLLGTFRKGPAIPDHKDAECYLPPEDSESKLDQMFCSAAQDNLLIQLTTYGAKPFGKQDAADLYEMQLNYAQTPGESV